MTKPESAQASGEHLDIHAKAADFLVPRVRACIESAIVGSHPVEAVAELLARARDAGTGGAESFTRQCRCDSSEVHTTLPPCGTCGHDIIHHLTGLCWSDQCAVEDCDGYPVQQLVDTLAAAHAAGVAEGRRLAGVDAAAYRNLREQAEAALASHLADGGQRTGRNPMFNPTVATEIIRAREYAEHARAAQDEPAK